MAAKIPTLSPKGFVEAVSDKADHAMLNFYVSQYSQTNLFRDSNKPLAYIVQQNGTSAIAMRDALVLELTTYLNRIFDFATVDVSSDEEGSSIKLRLDVIIRDSSKEYSFGHEIMTSNSKIVDIVDISNSGSLIRMNPSIFNS
jgi:hypothetical protein